LSALVKIQENVLLPSSLSPENIQKYRVQKANQRDHLPKVQLKPNVRDVSVCEAAESWDRMN